jgi:hypothetical protein
VNEDQQKLIAEVAKAEERDRIVALVKEMRRSWLSLANVSVGSATYYRHKARVCSQVIEAIEGGGTSER